MVKAELLDLLVRGGTLERGAPKVLKDRRETEGMSVLGEILASLGWITLMQDQKEIPAMLDLQGHQETMERREALENLEGGVLMGGEALKDKLETLGSLDLMVSRENLGLEDPEAQLVQSALLEFEERTGTLDRGAWEEHKDPLEIRVEGELLAARASQENRAPKAQWDPWALAASLETMVGMDLEFLGL